MVQGLSSIKKVPVFENQFVFSSDKGKLRVFDCFNFRWWFQVVHLLFVTSRYSLILKTDEKAPVWGQPDLSPQIC